MLRSLATSQVMLGLTEPELESCLSIDNPLHRRKLSLAIEEFQNPSVTITYVVISDQWFPMWGKSPNLDLGNGSNKFGNHCFRRMSMFDGVHLVLVFRLMLVFHLILVFRLVLVFRLMLVFRLVLVFRVVLVFHLVLVFCLVLVFSCGAGVFISFEN